MSSIVKIQPPKSDPDVVTLLREALQRAENGETTGVMVMEQLGTSCKCSIIGFKNRFEKLGVCAHAMYKLQSDET